VELSSGFKRTELGPIPESWAIKPLSAITEKIMVGIASAATHAYRRKGIPMFRNQNIKKGWLDDSELLFIDPEYERAFRAKRLRAGDLLTMRTGYPGVTTVVPAQYEGAQSFTTLISRPKLDKVDSHFLCHFINSAIGQRFFVHSQIGGAQKNVNAGTLRGMPVVLPSIDEQRAIAEALSSIDAMIEGYSRLITKKRGTRQAAMQQLLTGRVRLSSFDGEWNRHKLCTLIQHIWPKSLLTSGDGAERGQYPLFVSGGTPKRIDVAHFRDADVLCFADGGVFSVRRVTGDFSVTDHCYVMSLNTAIADNYWCCAWLTLNAAELDRMTFKGSGLRNLDKGALLDIELPCPKPAEQHAISTVLSDMDAELAALEARLEKTKALKEAMMQELLTGRTRLVAPEPAHA
jgi:type I restriction enzyme, S subunit